MLHCNAGRYGAIKRYLMLYRQIARLLGATLRRMVQVDGLIGWLAPAFPRRAESASGASISRGRMDDELGTPGWRNGRRRGLKIPWSESSVRVRVPLPAPCFLNVHVAFLALPPFGVKSSEGEFLV
jgi:hypothetical protein